VPVTAKRGERCADVERDHAAASLKTRARALDDPARLAPIPRELVERTVPGHRDSSGAMSVLPDRRDPRSEVSDIGALAVGALAAHPAGLIVAPFSNLYPGVCAPGGRLSSKIAIKL
jgi:hypothetical protein